MRKRSDAMPLQIQKIKASKTKEVRVAYNKMFQEDVKNDYFTEEQIETLTTINKQHLIRILIEYKRIKYEMDHFKEHHGYHLILKLEKSNRELYRFHFYEVDYHYHVIIPIVSSCVWLTKNEVEAFLYAYSKFYSNELAKENAMDTIYFTERDHTFEFLWTSTLEVNQLKELYQIYQNYQQYQTCQRYCFKK